MDLEMEKLTEGYRLRSNILRPTAFDDYRRDQPGALKNRIEAQKAVIAARKQAVKELEDGFATIQTKRAEDGFPPLPAMPDDMAEKLEVAQARLQVGKDELRVLKHELQSREQREEQEAHERVLKNGPRGMRKRDLIDGQRIERDPEDGVLKISDQRSPHDKMPLQRYYMDIVRPFLEKRRLDLNAQDRERRAKEQALL